MSQTENTTNTSQNPEPPQPDPALKRRSRVALWKYGAARVVLFIVLTAVIQLLAMAVLGVFPLLVSALLALFVAAAAVHADLLHVAHGSHSDAGGVLRAAQGPQEVGPRGAGWPLNRWLNQSQRYSVDNRPHQHRAAGHAKYWDEFRAACAAVDGADSTQREGEVEQRSERGPGIEG